MWLPASGSAAGVSGTSVLLTRFGRGENEGREKGEDCNKVFPNGLGSGGRGGEQRAVVGVSRSGGMVFSFLGRWCRCNLTKSGRFEEARGTDSAGGGENDRALPGNGRGSSTCKTCPGLRRFPEEAGRTMATGADVLARSGLPRVSWRPREGRKARRAGPLRHPGGVSGNARWARPAGTRPATCLAEPELALSSQPRRGLGPAILPLSVFLGPPPGASVTSLQPALP